MSPPTSSVLRPMRSRRHVPRLRQVRLTPRDGASAAGSATRSRMRSASSSWTISGCGTRSAGPCSTLDLRRARWRPHVVETGAVQILEATELGGVRSAVWLFRHPVTRLSFELYPMLHVGEASFFRAVEERLRRCQLVVEEGVRGGKTAVGPALLAYRSVPFPPRLGLVAQDIDPAALGIPTINPDLSRAEFDERWREVPWQQRVTRAAMVTVSSVGIQFFATRRWLAQFLAMNDLPEGDDILAVDPDDAIENL